MLWRDKFATEEEEMNQLETVLIDMNEKAGKKSEKKTRIKIEISSAEARQFWVDTVVDVVVVWIARAHISICVPRIWSRNWCCSADQRNLLTMRTFTAFFATFPLAEMHLFLHFFPFFPVVNNQPINSLCSTYLLFIQILLFIPILLFISY